MTRTGLTAVALSLGSLAIAQVPQPGGPLPPPVVGQPAAPPVAPAVMAELEAWWKVMNGAKSFAAECTKTVEDKVNKRDSRFKGSIWCMKPTLARVSLSKIPPPGQQPNPNDIEAYICDGKAIYAYDTPSRTVKVHALQNPGVGDNLLLEFMSGTITPQQVAARFQVAELPGKVGDPSYLYLDIQPRLAKDQMEFERMTLVLVRPALAPAQAYLPRIAQIVRKKGQEVETWDFPSPVLNSPSVTPAAFQFVNPGPDWKVERVQPPPAAAPGQPGAPRVVRQ